MTKRFRADLSLAFCSLLWGATFVVVKNSLGYSSVFVFLAARFTLAALLMAAFRPHVFRTLKKGRTARRRRPRLLHVRRLRLPNRWPAIHHSREVRLRHRLQRRHGPVAARHFLGTPPHALGLRGVFAAVFGLYFLTVPAEGVSHLNRGDLLTFVAAGLYAMHIILVGDYTRRHSVAALSVLQVAACAALAWLATG